MIMNKYEYPSKLRKHISKLECNYNIKISEITTKYVVIFNGGLENNIIQEKLVAKLKVYGPIKKHVFESRRSYSWVEFENESSAEQAVLGISGVVQSDLQTTSNTRLKLYLFFVTSLLHPPVPSEDVSRCVQPPMGLTIINDWIDKSVESDLLNDIDWSSNTGSLKQRRVTHYGYEFLYTTNNVDLSSPLDSDWPPSFQPIRDRLRSYALSKASLCPCGHACNETLPDQLTINEYQPGQGIPSHVDTHSAFHEDLYILSLGAQVNMEFKPAPVIKRDNPGGAGDSEDVDTFSVTLPRFSLTILSGPARYAYTHSIASRFSDQVSGVGLVKREMRTSFTFRRVLEGPCECDFSEFCDSIRKPIETAQDLESMHVHKVYNQIAEHFSDTRHSGWPKVIEFLQSLQFGDLCADIGCGNGKYLSVNDGVYKIGCDRSGQLLDICGQRDHEVFRSDALYLPFRAGSQDAAISIAVIHHFSTKERRIQAIEAIVNILRKGGRALISVWAYEQKLKNKSSHYIDHEMSDEKKLQTQNEVNSEINVKDLTLTKHVNRTQFKSKDLLVPWNLKGKQKNESKQFHRYYHVFNEGELENYCLEVDGVEIEKSYYDNGNWCVIISKK